MEPLLATALDAADAAAQIHLAHFGRIGLEGAREKGRSDFVSQVDLEAQAAAVSVIQHRFPDHRILAEENEPGALTHGSWPGDGSFLWIIDPLDGTTNFLHGHPFFAASVAVGRATRPGRKGEESGDGWGGGVRMATGPGRKREESGDGWDEGVRIGGVLEAGAVVAPRTGERWWAGRGRGAWKNGIPIQTSRRPSIQASLIGTGFPFKAPELLDRYLDQFQRILPRSGGIRRAGSAAMDLCHLAEGVLDAFWEEAYLSPWDVAAGLLILEEAGGVGSRADGTEIDLEPGSILAEPAITSGP